MTESRAFQFAANGRPPAAGPDAAPVRRRLEGASAGALAGYVRRGDFSRWIADVFGDNALADELRAEEQRFTHAWDPRRRAGNRRRHPRQV